ncbi:Inositol-1-monophosphatase [Buchnera aphidicola (Eriosoma grossulariae)]|uniref:inositol monophosphatase family protein n=1 Tax=Buchnera aphidicola TaxID=9 RepID=UPI003464DA39
MHPMLNIAIRAVRKGGNFIVQKYDLQKNTICKDNNINNLENIIYISEKKIIETISKSYPHHAICTNKTILNKKFNEIQWIINPLDGITNFSKNIPHFCISIAVQIKNQTEISVIYDPIKNELFTAIKGKGAQINGYRMRCNNVSKLMFSTISINILNQHKSHNLYLQIMKILLIEKIHFRLSGSNTLDLAYVATGRLDCLFNMNFTPWSFYAGELQLKESGALICDFRGGCNYLQSGISLIGHSKFIRLVFDKIKNIKY